MYVVTVEFIIDPAQIEAFMPLMRENARLSLETEPGCRQFDVCVSPEQPGAVLLYEVYDDRAAFDQHLASAHFAAFDKDTGAMVLSKTVRSWDK